MDDSPPGGDADLLLTSTTDGHHQMIDPNPATPVLGRLSPLRGRTDLLPAERNAERGRRAAAYSSEEEESPPVEVIYKNSKWRERPGLNLKYVDDNLSLEKIFMKNADRDPTNPKLKFKHAIASQNKFRWVIRRAEERGMKVNSSKTSMICISDAMSYQAEAFIKDWEGNRIESGDLLKILGFHFSDRPTVHAHVKALQKRFRRQY